MYEVSHNTDVVIFQPKKVTGRKKTLKQGYFSVHYL